MARKNKSNELAEMLRYQIVSGRLRPGDQLEAIVKLAKRYETTVATVSKALESLEQSGYVERFAGKGVFVRKKQECRLALVLDSGAWDHDSASITFIPILLNELEKMSQAENWTYELFFSVDSLLSAQSFLLKLAQNAFDAVLIGSNWLADNAAKIFAEKSVLTVGVYPFKKLEYSISFDLYEMVRSAVLELDHHNCRQIALVDSNKDQSWSKLPEATANGYAEGMKQIGQWQNPQLHLKVPISQAGGYQAFEKLLGLCRNSRPFGIISIDSMITLGIIQAVLSSGLKIGEDVIIVTHANHGCGAAQFTVPIIRYEYSVHLHMERIAALIKQYTDGQRLQSGVYLLPPKRSISAPQETLVPVMSD